VPPSARSRFSTARMLKVTAMAVASMHIFARKAGLPKRALRFATIRMLPLTASTTRAPHSQGMKRRKNEAMLWRVPATPSRRRSNIAMEANTTEIARM